MRIIITAVLVLASVQVVWAQPGYMGKKLVAGYQLQVMNATNNNNAQNKRGLTAFNLTHSPKLEMAIGRRASLGLMAQIGKTGFNGSYEVSNFGFIGSAIENNHSYGYTDYRDELEITHQAIRLLYRKYSASSGAIAPVGRYMELGLGVQQIALQDRNDQYVFYETNHGQVSLAYGRSRVLFDKVVMDMAFQFMLSLPIAHEKFLSRDSDSEMDIRYGNQNEYVDYYSVSDYENESVVNDIHNRIFLFNAVNIRLGISGLLF